MSPSREVHRCVDTDVGLGVGVGAGDDAEKYVGQGASLGSIAHRSADFGSTARLSACIVTLVAFLFLSSCYTSIGRWTYPSGRYRTTESTRTAAAFVVVEPFLDVRGDKNLSSMVWSYVPCVPFGWSEFDRPEATIHGADTTQYLAEPRTDLARSIVVELQRERLVEHAVFADDYHHEGGETHVLRGKLRSFFVKEQRWTYGLSVYATIIWGLGFPQGRSCNGFCVDLELVDVKTSSVVWRATIFDADDHVEAYYYGPEWYRFSRMWERRLREKIGGLAVALGAEAAPLPANLYGDDEGDPLPKMPERLGVDAASR